MLAEFLLLCQNSVWMFWQILVLKAYILKVIHFTCLTWNFWSMAVFPVQKSWRRSVGFKRKILRRENKFSKEVDRWAAQYWTANVFLFRKVEYEGRFILASTAFLHFVMAIFNHVYVKLNINKVQNLFMNKLGDYSPESTLSVLA